MLAVHAGSYSLLGRQLTQNFLAIPQVNPVQEPVLLHLQHAIAATYFTATLNEFLSLLLFLYANSRCPSVGHDGYILYRMGGTSLIFHYDEAQLNANMVYYSSIL